MYDLEVTPNRPDLNSLIGIAREIAALTGNALKMPEVKPEKAAPSATELVAIRLEDAELCPRYAARVVRGVKIGPSPDWLKQTLEKIGIRSINNVVDVTNFVMLESGQGRIPVVDPATGVLQGLITRKDLLKIRAAATLAETHRESYFKPSGGAPA